ncbi:NAD(P)-dependent oxidoreductase [Pseudemcibacter aquimaris]|uniref:NAD(P)-dependent oxidoreductase n=1 Tax=Pseudemcibacter aquimaris TaxID=2857064 RepID=UPI00201197FA|nr:NAD(P)-dependent oxidoreductase [Pseudemcibacter aquimaris]MCC3861916.1 NAD(P)-dependent oxidoreductase [Pseudemcibacter aquimaris]WDU58668.1 NAD(P)-dependent oxidoreductase [Pseudemcibacter aquimaris]
MKVSFIGLGVMGYPMAGHLKNAGHDVTVYNRTSAKAEKWAAEYNGAYAKTPKDAATESEIVFICVGNDDDVRSVVYGDDGILAGMEPGSILIDHTTTSAILARELGEACADKKIAFLDAPVSGGQAGAENGVLTVMMGGDDANYDKASPIIDCYAQKTKLLGAVGSGQLAKMVNQICIAGVVQGLSEALNFAMKTGLNADDVVDVISKGAAQSWQMENRSNTMVRNEFDFGFALDWMRKDLGFAIDEADKKGIPLPVTKLVDEFYAEIQQNGGGRWDTSALITLLNK